MANTASATYDLSYRPLPLKSYRPSSGWRSPNEDFYAESRARREACRRRVASRKAARIAMTKAIQKVVVIGTLLAILAIAVLVRMTASISPVIEENGRGGHVADVTEVTGDAGMVVPDIAGDCPIVYQRADDGSFVSNNGFAIGSGCRFGVDVSEHDGEIDWETAKEGGVDFAIIRCGYGSDETAYDDACWERNASECERLGIPYGAYLYSYASDPSLFATEADHVARLVEGHSVPLGIWYDIEEPSQAEAFGYDANKFDELVDGFASSVEARTGIEVGVYTSLSWLEGHMSQVYEGGDHPLWCACWTDSNPTSVSYDYWQAGVAVISGFENPVDFDVLLG